MAQEELSYDELLRRAGSKYSLAVAVAKRARQIHDDAEVLIDSDSKKPVTVALEEFARGRLGYRVTMPDGETETWPRHPQSRSEEDTGS